MHHIDTQLGRLWMENAMKLGILFQHQIQSRDNLDNPYAISLMFPIKVEKSKRMCLDSEI